MMSGVLLAVALYAIMRWKVVVDAAVGPRLHEQLFSCSGCSRSLIAAFSLVIQRNYKRMLAYSSIEHTGLICVGLGARASRGVRRDSASGLTTRRQSPLLFLLSGEVLAPLPHHRTGTGLGPAQSHALDRSAVLGGCWP